MAFGIRSGGVMDRHADRNSISPVKMHLIFIFTFMSLIGKGDRADQMDQTKVM